MTGSKLFGGGSASAHFHVVGNTRRFVHYQEQLSPRRRPRAYRCVGFTDEDKLYHPCIVLVPNKRDKRCPACEIAHRFAIGELVECACGELVARWVSYCGDCKARGASKRSRILRLAKSRLTYQQIAARTGASYPYVARVMAQIKTAPVI